MLTEVHAIFIGRVQGVGFRYTAERYAIELGIAGTVRNLPDGSVELIAQGDRKRVQMLIDCLINEAFPGKITETKVTFRNIQSPFADFRIL